MFSANGSQVFRSAALQVCSPPAAHLHATDKQAWLGTGDGAPAAVLSKSCSRAGLEIGLLTSVVAVQASDTSGLSRNGEMRFNDFAAPALQVCEMCGISASWQATTAQARIFSPGLVSSNHGRAQLQYRAARGLSRPGSRNQL